MTRNLRTRRPANRAIHYPLFGNILSEIFEDDKKKAIRTNNRLKYNIKEYDNRFTVEIALPGYTKEQVAIDLEDNVLSISNVAKKEETEASYRLREFNFAGFKKSFQLPETVDQDKINASYQAGILILDLHKKKEAIPQPPKSIKIK